MVHMVTTDTCLHISFNARKLAKLKESADSHTTHVGTENVQIVVYWPGLGQAVIVRV